MKSKEKKKLTGFKKFLIIYPAVFVILSGIVFVYLYGLLKDYEASEPNNVMEEFVGNMTADSIGSLLEDTDMELTEFESMDVLEDYFVSKVADKEITYKRKSGEFTQSTPVYVLTAGEEVIAKVTLKESGKNSHNFSEWKIGSIEFTDYESETQEVTILAPANAEVFVNGVKVGDSYKSQEDTIVTETKNIGDYTESAYMSSYKIAGLMKAPDITATLDGSSLGVVANEGTYEVSFPTDEALLAEQQGNIKVIMEDYGRYIINRGNLETLLSHTVGTAKTYLSDIPAVWAYLWGVQYTYEFQNESITDLVKYSENCFSVEVYFDLVVDFNTGNDIKKTSMTYIFVKQDNNWYLADFIQHKVE